MDNSPKRFPFFCLVVFKTKIGSRILRTNALQDYRASLLREIMERTKREGEQVSSDVELTNRHTVCHDQVENISPYYNLQSLLAARHHVLLLVMRSLIFELAGI